MTMKMLLAGMMMSGAVALAQGPEMGDAPDGGMPPMNKDGGMPEGKGDHHRGMMGGGCMGGMQGGCPIMGGMMNADKLQEAGATEQQIKDVEAIQSAAEKEAVTLKANAELAQLKMKEAMKVDSPDEKTVGEAFDAVSAARAAQMKASLMTMIKVKKILGAEVMKKMKPRGREHGTKGGMGMRQGGKPQGMTGAGMPPPPMKSPAEGPGEEE